MKKRTFVIYHDYIPRFGGIETAISNLARELNRVGVDVLIAFRNAQDYRSLLKYSEYADVVRLDSIVEPIECDVCLLGSNHRIPNGINAERFLQWVHSDYKRYPIKLDNIGSVDYIAVSNHSADVIKELYDIDCKVIYNLVPEKEKVKKTIKLVTMSRVSQEKGFDRMLAMAKKLVDLDIRFRWLVFGDNTQDQNYYNRTVQKFKDIEGVMFVGFKTDITYALEDADMLVQLSDFEGCPLSLLEALSWEVPILATNWLGVEEIVKDGENGYIVDMNVDMWKDSELKKIFKNIPKFKYEPLSTVEEWVKLIKK